MRAIVLHEYGSPDVLRLEEVSRPQPIPTEVQVRVHAAGVNPVDFKTRAGRGMAGVLALLALPIALGAVLGSWVLYRLFEALRSAGALSWVAAGLLVAGLALHAAAPLYAGHEPTAGARAARRT